MKPDIQFLKTKFAEFNAKIFGSRLPEPLITLCDVTSFVGQYKSRIRTLPDGRREHYDHQLRFSTAFSLEERELEDTVIHEMIHYFIAYNGLQDRTAHGPLFKALMQSVNEAHGRSIGISHRTAPGQVTDNRKKWHIVAILHFADGQLGVKVLPRVVERVVEYYRGITAAPNIKRVDLYLHNDPFFNRFPTSTGRRCQLITPSDVAAHLTGAHTLRVEGRRLLQT